MSIMIYDELQPVEPRAVPLPEVSGPLPATPESYPFNSAARQTVPSDLQACGYVEEEYILSGTANVYAWNRTGQYPMIRASGCPYATRILVRRPADPNKFSGFAVVEPMNWGPPCEKALAAWGMSGETMMQSGDVWVGATVRAKTIGELKKFDAARYASLGFPNPFPPEKRGKNSDCYEKTDPETENGLIWDMLSSLAALLKSPSGENPLHVRPADYVLAVGATAGDLTTYVAAVHPFALTAKGKPCFDGYNIHMTGYPGNINQEETHLEPDDDRCKLFCNVPIIRTNTMGDMTGAGTHPDYSYAQRRHDSNLPGQQYRLYELAGAPLGTPYDRRGIPCAEDILKAGGQPNLNPFVPDAAEGFPTRYLLRAALDNLKRWVSKGAPPPRAERLLMKGSYPDAELCLDPYGNALGGVRTPYVDVPVCTYCVTGEVLPFDKALLRKLYPTHNYYMTLVIKSAQRCAEQRFLLPQDAREIVKAARLRADWWNDD